MNKQEQKQIPTIKELIEGATPGPWGYYPALTSSENHRGYWVQAGEGRNASTIAQVMPLDEDGLAGAPNAQLIARCSPSVMREVVEALELSERYLFNTPLDGTLTAHDKITRALSLLSATANPESK
jgi:hypothetical protein